MAANLETKGSIGFENVIVKQPSPGFFTTDEPENYGKKPQSLDSQPVTKQPLDIDFKISTNEFPGLEYLASVDQLLVHQQIEIIEILTGFETRNKYQVKNSVDQPVFFVAEKSSCCSRFCCGTIRGLQLKVLDNFGTEVLNFERPLRCDTCLFPCCLQELTITSPLTGITLGTIEQNWNPLFPSLTIRNAQHDKLFNIKGPFFTCSFICCCNDVSFEILSAKDKSVVGTITKQWSGFCKEAFTDADNFSVTFPIDMDVQAKGLLLAALFLIDYMYYETSNNNQNVRAEGQAVVCLCEGILSCL